MTSNWHPASWRMRPAAQMPVYEDAAALEAAETKLRSARSIARPEVSESLKRRLAEAARGRALLLQGGDCAELFGAHNPQSVAALAGLFGSMAKVLERQSGVPAVRIARIAGQFGKPRTMAYEERDSVALPVWRGEIVNDRAFGADARHADPQRMLTAHAESVRVAALLPDGLFTSHEALLLPYEEALVRRGADGRSWSVSAHFLWVGERTRQLDGAHVEFLSGIANPIGVKCGPDVRADELLRLADRLDPRHEQGRLTLIVRHGVDEIGKRLPPLMRALKAEGRQALWVNDPMHGNTVRRGHHKLRWVDSMLEEARRFSAIAQEEGVWPGGLHLEMTADDVGECMGIHGPGEPEELGPRWTSACDPRLNGAQALEFIEQWAALLRPRVAA